MLIPEDMAISESSKAYKAMLTPLKKDGKLNTDPEMLKRVKNITSLLVAQAILYRPDSKSWNWSVQVIDEPEVVNAWAMAGGRMAIYSGLITKLEATDDEIAQVMAHEISHALLAHTQERMSRALAMQLGITAMSIALQDEKYGGIAIQGTALAAIVALELPNSRTAESESDRIGIEIAAKAGFDPRAAVTLWKKMADESGQKDSRFDFLSTHPAPVKRVEELEKLTEAMMPYYDEKSPRPTHPVSGGEL
jgi:predicted Zn-dependent protease